MHEGWVSCFRALDLTDANIPKVVAQTEWAGVFLVRGNGLLENVNWALMHKIYEMICSSTLLVIILRTGTAEKDKRAPLRAIYVIYLYRIQQQHQPLLPRRRRRRKNRSYTATTWIERTIIPIDRTAWTLRDPFALVGALSFWHTLSRARPSIKATTLSRLNPL